jgi:glycosyltransferase involved in cell wall biosynthesis
MQLLPNLLATERPDVVFTQGHQREQLALLASSVGIPSIIRVVCAEDVDWVEALARTMPNLSQSISTGRIPVVSNSEFVASRVLKQLNIESTVVYPLVSLDLCVSSEHRPEFITFINPIPKKGIDLAIGIASLLPQRKFVFVESWHLDRKSRRELEVRLAGLPNIQLRPATTDMRILYQDATLLLAPSQVEEAFGRVVLEACANGIPVVASAIGGIPEALGGGGLLVSATEPADHWAQAIESVLGNPDLYRRLSSAGIAHARQTRFHVDTIGATFAQLARAHAGHRV